MKLKMTPFTKQKNKEKRRYVNIKRSATTYINKNVLCVLKSGGKVL